MKLTSARVLLPLFLAAVLILGTRLVWVASTAETGWETLGLSWYNAILGPVGLKREPIGDRDPAQQADIWLREVDRVLATHPDDAQIAMGAAWMLDSPGQGFLRKYTKFDTSFSPFIIPQVDNESVAGAEDRFEAKCTSRCLELAARATELEPENVDWWRLRALLLFRKSVYSDDDPVPRDPNWLAVLDECARHDPDNALYDYLAALRLWTTSGKHDWDKSVTLRILQVENPERFAEGVARFDQGQRKECVAVGAAALPAVAEFLGHARLPHKEEAHVGFQRLADSRAQGFLMKLHDWQRSRAGTQEQAGDVAGAVALWRQQHHALQQAVAGGDSRGLRSFARRLSPPTLATIAEVAKRHPNSMSVEELAGIETDVEDELVDVYVANDASQAVGPITRDRQFPGDTVPVQATKVARALCILMLIVGAVNWGTARWLLNAGGPPPLGTVRHLSAWVVGWGVTLFLLGICPAETLDPDLQATIITFATWLVGIGILVVVFRTLVSLLRTPTQGSKRLPVVSFVAVITLWQATVAIALTTVAPFFHGSTFFVLKRTIRGVIPFAVPAALIVAGWGLFRYRRRTGHLPKVPFAALGLMALSALLVTGAFALDPDYLGPDCWPPVSDWEGLDGAAVNKLLNGTYNANLGDLEVTAPSVTPEARYCWALYQWRAHAGLLASPGLSLLLVAVWHSARQTRQRLQTAASQPRPSCRARWGALLHCLGRSALAMAACFLLLYLAAAPAVLRSVEDDYQRTVAYLRNPLVYWAKVREAEVAIRADATTMDGIRARVADFIARTEEESTDEEPESEP